MSSKYKLSGKRAWATAQNSSCKFPQVQQDAHEALYQQRKADIRRAWLETPDQGLDFGLTGIKDAKSTIASFLWTDSDQVRHRVCREVISYSGNTREELDKTPIAKRVEKLVTEAMEADPAMRKPPIDLITFIIAQLLLRATPHTKNKPRLYAYLESNCGKEGKAKDLFPEAYAEAIDILRTEKRDWEAVRKDLQACSAIVKKAIGDINKTWKPRAKIDSFEQYDRDQKAIKDDNILCPVPDDVIYLLVDKHNEVLVFRWSKGLDWFFGQDFNDTAMASLQTYIAHKPPFIPQRTRHVMHQQWLRTHPGFDYTKTKGAACGTYYFGIGGERGHPEKGLIVKAGSAGKAWKDREHNKGAREILRLRKELMTQGFIPAITRAHMFIQGILDPELLRKQQEVMTSFQDKAIMTVPNDPYSLKAVLVDVLTTDHIDEQDWHRGFAMMSTLGQYVGGDLGLRQLGRRLGYPPGAIIAIKGHEEYHMTDDWTGQHRISVVNVCQTFARQLHLEDQRAQGATITDADELQILDDLQTLQAKRKGKGRKDSAKKDAKVDTVGDAQEDEDVEEEDEDAEFELTDAQAFPGLDNGEQDEQDMSLPLPWAAKTSSLESRNKRAFDDAGLRQESSVTHKKARGAEILELEEVGEKIIPVLVLDDDEGQKAKSTEYLELEEIGGKIIPRWVLD